MSKSFLRKIAIFAAVIISIVSLSSCSKNKGDGDNRNDIPNLVIGCE